MPTMSEGTGTRPVSTEFALRADGLTKTFANGAGIHDISFEAPARGVLAVIGPNGSGKTTLFTLLTQLVRADRGTITLGTSASRIAYCPDVPQFESWLTAEEIVTASHTVAGVTPTMTAAHALHSCGLGKVRDRKVAGFSRGMLQRLGIAATLVLDPDVLILDEPSSALDPIGKADIRDLIAEQKKLRSIILSSHSLSEVEQTADSILVLADGRIVSHGTTEQILTKGITPTWHIRVAADPTVLLRALQTESGVVDAQLLSERVIEARFSTLERGQALLPSIISLSGIPLVELTLADRDLDTAFARIIKEATH